MKRSPGRYQELDLFIKVLRLLCPNLTDASRGISWHPLVTRKPNYISSERIDANKPRDTRIVFLVSLCLAENESSGCNLLFCAWRLHPNTRNQAKGKTNPWVREVVPMTTIRLTTGKDIVCSSRFFFVCGIENEGDRR